MKLSDLVVQYLVAREKRQAIEMAGAGDAVDLPNIGGLRIFGTKGYLTVSYVVVTPKSHK